MATRRRESPPDWRYFAHNALLILFSPLVLLYLLWRVAFKGKSRAGFVQRLGFVPPEAAELASHDDPVVWFQACSVGEVASVEAIINRFRELEPLSHIVLSTTTPTGHDMAVKRGIEVDALIYFPFDIPWCVRRAMRSIEPDMLVTVDTELWPNVLSIARRRGMPVAVVNARISDKAYPKDRMIKPVLSWAMSHFSAVLAQSQKDADRFVSLGAPAERVEVLGNCKFDEPMPDVRPAEADKLRMELGLQADAPVFVAGSTREGEDEQVLEAFELMRQEIRDLQLVIAPRHPERGDAIEKLVTDRGFAAYRRSRAAGNEGAANPPAAGGQVRVVILDTIGELTRVYSLASVVFVGGSLVPWGGHNILQPIALGKPTLMGPWMHNFQDVTDIALAEQAARQVHSAQELAEVASAIITSEPEQQLYATRGQAMLKKHQGAARRYAEKLSSLLREAPQPTGIVQA